MSTPSICCVCLTADRQRLTDRAVRCFLSQTYENANLLIYDNGREAYQLPDLDREQSRKIIVCRVDHRPGVTIPRLRNEANGMASGADAIAHFDSDDWSHPERLSLQMEDLAARHCTGFSNMLFFDSREGKKNAWEYTYNDQWLVLGTSLVYWRSIWEGCPFNESKIEGEEKWWPNCQAHGRNGFELFGTEDGRRNRPLMIANYHGGNTGQYGKGANGVPCIFDQTPGQRAQNPQFRRAPEWDQYCQEVMK